MKLFNIGLNPTESEKLATELNELLANLQIYYQNLRGLHWNIQGENFFELHVKFEELYNDSQEKIDMVAERILTLGHTPLHTFEDYQNLANVPVGKNISQDRDALELIVNSLSILLEKERLILNLSDEADDEGTNSMMSDFISEQEKLVWMFSAWLSK
ncbi:DNA protection during starvation protein [Flavobacteriaceae bacterium UJ101]|nr:DNA protection during starvation protein [Flavobacteriaceae bacterium UJ101]